MTDPSAAVTDSFGDSGRLTVLVLDDHPATLEALADMIATDETLTVIGSAIRIEDAVRLAADLQPDVAVLDVNMPEGGGWAAARRLQEAAPGIRLVAHSAFDDALITRTIVAAGISAYVIKGSEIGILLAAIHGEHLLPEPSESTPLMHRTAARAR